MKISRLFWSCLFAAAVLPARASEKIENSIQIIEDAYPRTDYIGGSFTFIFAAMALSRGLTMADNERLSNHERQMGQALTILGTVRIADGLSRFVLDPYSVQRIQGMRHRGENPGPELESWAANARFIRFVRAHMVMATGLIYLNLAFSGKEEYADLPETGAFLVALAAYQYGKLTPEEEALHHFQDWGKGVGQWQWRFLATPEYAAFVVQTQF